MYQEKESNLCPWFSIKLEIGDWTSKHRGLARVASGKSIWIHWAYSWVEMSTPLSSCTTWCFLISVYILCLALNILEYMLVVWTLMNGFCVEMFAWCFDRKWWLHAYVRMTTFSLYIFEWIQFSSLFSGDLFPLFVSHVALDRFPHKDILSGSFPYIPEPG